MFCKSIVGAHWFIPSYMNEIILILSIGGMVIDWGKPKYFEKEVSLCPSQIPHGLTWIVAC
jgi:hypothetical protein